MQRDNGVEQGRTADALPPITFAIDDNYAPQLCVALRSLAAANSAHVDRLKVIVLHDSLSDSTVRRLLYHAADAGIDLEVREVRHRCESFPTLGWITLAAYLRLMMTEVLPEYERTVYLDADILVRGDLLPLLETDLGDRPLAAVQDPMMPVLRCNLAIPGWAELGLDGGRQYFNSGVLVFNLRACREQETLRRALWYLHNKPQHILFHDQDALNIAADDDWHRLDRCWNTFPVADMVRAFGRLPFEDEMLPVEVLVADEDTARIMHYAGPFKPWQDQYPQGRWRDRYREAFAEVEDRESAFAG